MPGSAPASVATICEPSSCTSNQPFWKAGSAWTLGWRPSPSIGAMRMPFAAIAAGRAPVPSSSLSTSSVAAFSVLTLRSSGGRIASAEPSSTQRSPKFSSSSGAHQSGQSAFTAGGAASSLLWEIAASSADVSGGGANLSPSSAAPSFCGVSLHSSSRAPMAMARGVSSPRSQPAERLRRSAS